MSLESEAKEATRRAAEENGAAGEGMKRKRGRPPGSKNKPREGAEAARVEPSGGEKAGPKAKLPPMDPFLIEFISDLPLRAAKAGAEKWIAKGDLPDLDPDTLKAVHEAFGRWLESLDIVMGPGGELILAYFAAVSSIGIQAAVMRAMIVAEEAARRAEEKRARDAGASTTGQTVTVPFTKQDAPST